MENEDIRTDEQVNGPAPIPVPETVTPPQPPPTKKDGKNMQKIKTVFAFLFMCAMLGAGLWATRDLLPFAFSRRAPGSGPYIITAATYSGTGLSEDGASFTADFKIDVIEKKGWKKIELLPAHVAIVKSKLPRNSYLHLEKGMYCMLTKEDGEMEVSIAFSVATKEAEGKCSVAFTRVPALTCVLDATFQQEDVAVTVRGAQSTDVSETNGTTRVVAALPDETPIEVTWEKALPEIKEGPSKFHAETKTLISITEGLIIGQAKMDFSILHTPTRELELNVPEGVSVISIDGKGIRDWRVTDGKLAIQLEKEVVGPFVLNLKYEASPNMASGKVVIPVITGSNVEREKGTVGVVALTNLEIKNSGINNAHLIDVKELPSEIVGMTTQPILLAYRYIDPDFEVTLDISKHKDIGVLLTMIDRAHFTVMQTYDGKRITRALYNVRNNRNQFLRLQLPRGAELWSAAVEGRSIQPARDAEGRILLPLVKSGGGEMSAFPVEIVYAEEGTAPDERGRGEAIVALPHSSEPIMHLMVSLYLPQEGRYSDFSGTLRSVDTFTAVGSSHVMPVDNRAVSTLQQAYVGNVGQMPGAETIKVQLPVSGKVIMLEKILVVKDEQWFSYSFSRLQPTPARKAPADNGLASK
jgi:hypothetical protein